MLKNILKKANPPLPIDSKEKISIKPSNRGSKDRSSFLEKKRTSSRKRNLSQKEESYHKSNRTNGYRSGKDHTRAQMDRLKKKKKNNYGLMKNYSMNSGKSSSIEVNKKGRERRKKGNTSSIQAKKEYGSISSKFKSSANYISRSFLRTGSDQNHMMKISDKIRSMRTYKR